MIFYKKMKSLRIKFKVLFYITLELKFLRFYELIWKTIYTVQLTLPTEYIFKTSTYDIAKVFPYSHLRL